MLNTEFDKWWKEKGATANAAEECGAYQAWEYRQIEIDALKSDLEFRTMAFDAAHHVCEERLKEISDLKAELEHR